MLSAGGRANEGLCADWTEGWQGSLGFRQQKRQRVHLGNSAAAHLHGDQEQAILWPVRNSPSSILTTTRIILRAAPVSRVKRCIGFRKFAACRGCPFERRRANSALTSAASAPRNRRPPICV